MTDRTIQLKIFAEDDDNPGYWLEWRKVDRETFGAVEQLLSKALGTPMNRSGD